MALPSVVLNRTQIKHEKPFYVAFRPLNEKPLNHIVEAKGKVLPKMPSWDDKDGEMSVPHPDNQFKLYQDIYRSIPVGKIAVDHTSNFAIQSGYELEGGKEAVKKIEDWIDDTNFMLTLQNAMLQMQIYGNAYLEINDLENMKFLPVDKMFVVVSTKTGDNGTILGYKQKIAGESEAIDFKPDEIVHFKWNVESGLDGGFYGISDYRNAVSTLTKLLNFQEDMGGVINRHANPIIHWIVGSQDSPGTTEQISNFKGNLGDREAGGDLITSWGVEAKTIATDLRMIQPDGILKHLENQLIAAFQVPEIFVRGGESSNKATADVELQAFDRRVKAIRKVVTTYAEDLIFPKISGVSEGEDKVRIAWAEPSFETESKKAEMVKNLIAGNCPLELALKIVGWGSFIDDLNAMGGEKEPMPFQKPGEPPGKPPKEEPKEKEFDNQSEYIKAWMEWKYRDK